MIVKGDIVFHELSKLYFICENNKMSRWMNMNKYYVLADKNVVEMSYFYKNK